MSWLDNIKNTFFRDTPKAPPLSINASQIRREVIESFREQNATRNKQITSLLEDNKSLRRTVVDQSKSINELEGKFTALNKKFDKTIKLSEAAQTTASLERAKIGQGLKAMNDRFNEYIPAAAKTDKAALLLQEISEEPAVKPQRKMAVPM